MIDFLIGGSGFGLAAKITSAASDNLETISLVVLDHILSNRVLVGVLGLSSAAAARIAGKFLGNPIRWYNGVVLSEVCAKPGLCSLHWRLLLTEGRWKIL